MRINEIANTLYVGQSKIPKAGRGVFAAEPISSGELFVLDPVVTISDSDWEQIKNTRFAKMMGLQWVGGEHVIPLGRIHYDLKPEDVDAFAATERFRNGVYVSPFLLVNHSENPNSVEVIDAANRMVGLRALRFIEPNEEITKRYNNAPLVRRDVLQFGD